MQKCIQAVVEGGNVQSEVNAGLIFLIKSEDKELLNDTIFLNGVVSYSL